MSKIKNGGPAFPFSALNPEGPEVYKDNEGMALRDYFAAKAMQALIAAKINDFRGGSAEFDETIARWSYESADAMLKVRGE